MKPEQAAGAAAMLTYLRDLIGDTEESRITKVQMLVLLETISRDEDFFPDGTGVEMWAMETEMVMEAEA